MEPLFFLLKSTADPPRLAVAFTVKPTFTFTKKYFKIEIINLSALPLSPLGTDFCFSLACTSVVKIWISVSRTHQTPPVGDWPVRGTHQPRESSCGAQSGGYLPRCREEELV